MMKTMLSLKPTMFAQLNLCSLLYVCVVLSLVNAQQQRVVPGVNPQHYQHVPVQQQQYQHPPQYQQQQQQQQQHHQQQQHQQPHQMNMPPAHMPVQQHHQVPMGDAHHGHHGQQQQVLHGANMNEERGHIQEHMQVPIDTSKMSEAELQFHYFKMHDSDNNNKLDGCELIKSLIHWHEQGDKEHQKTQNTEHETHAEEKVFSDDELVALIDPILQMDDTSRDGYIDYPEFIRAQQKAAQQNQQNQQQQNTNY